MGLLDDAIHEHLELKRLRGADPGEVAREQREALDPVPRDEPVAGEDYSAAPGEVASEGIAGTLPADAIFEGAGGAALVGGAPAGDHPSREPQPVHGPDFANVSQETAELDMRTVLDEEHAAPAIADDTHQASSVGLVPAGPVGGAYAAESEHPEEDSLEWEVPGDAPHEPAEHAGGHEHAAGDDETAETVGEWAAPDGPVEDALEETPDFLPDTPEQERLWLEQRTSRDFDFDK
jgi:hypothetical protein